jgi:hypothetical protein
MVSADAPSTDSDVTAGPLVTAAATISGKITYSSGCGFVPSTRPNTSCVMTSEAPANAIALIASGRSHLARAVVKIAGAMMIAPSASPNHQSNQRSPKRVHDWTPAMHSVATPTVALSVVHVSAAMTTNASTSATRRKAASKPGTRASAHAAATASSVLPVAMTRAVHRGAVVLAFAAKAPSQIAGHTRTPPSSTAASAIPVGAQTVVICSATTARRNPT